ncbi:GntR family transcriptional regulator [Hoeflea sp. YIM 152468]|uniref:GntR family transcriptional regulator n=1 Tax=Hoeflea sp. YIM 152468 TaxID=3031759 RepID=UPI0023DCC3D1|nr:GntR family transcriptional regulator [Hoeflea sp. YIM 152468]MDF1608102.1 GntR family transcriptional regulator [Hoeflea sp. YIM 152468]
MEKKLSGPQDAESHTGEPIGFKPLYAQVRERLVRRLVDGEWSPGMLLPSETELARQLKVSQGTVRKALDSMTADNLLLRRQGRGTYVAEPEESRILFQFFRLSPDQGNPSFPDSRVLSTGHAKPTKAETDALDLEKGDKVFRIERIRSLSGQPILVETITLPISRFPDFDHLTIIPNNLYRLYSERWGITIASAEERLKAIAASTRDAAKLGCDQGEPLLLISRLARDLEKRPVELRWSRCISRDIHYAVNLR